MGFVKQDSILIAVVFPAPFTPCRENNEPDSISRLIPGVLHNNVSAETESFHGYLLEYPQYTRPEEWHGKTVPPVLLSGHHVNIEKWRREQSIIRTAERRPDLLEKAELTQKEKEMVKKHLSL